jgi:oxygen-independent coproporphyrinogen-3 oxidase
MVPQLVSDVIRQLEPRLTENAEVGVEVHPRDATHQTLRYLRRAGVNRISLGIETFRDDLLRRIGRLQWRAGATRHPERARRGVRLRGCQPHLRYPRPGGG